jgi:four helix bundle protein
LRAAVSIPSNIAEGSERNRKADYNRFLSITCGFAAELRTQLYIASEIGIIDAGRAGKFIRETRSISKMLQAFSNSFDSSRRTVKLLNRKTVIT